MQPSQEFMDSIYRERVIRARRTPPEQKLAAGAELFDMCCEIMRDGIRMQYPDADPEQVEVKLRERLAIGERLEQSP